MKKITILAALIIMSASVFAQGIEFGVKTGLNLASQTKITGNTEMCPGIYAGFFSDYTINNFFGIQGELLYSMMGVKKTGLKGLLDGSTITNRTDYIVLPVLAKLYVAEKLSLDLGPQFGYMISAKEKFPTETINVYDDVDKKFDVSFGMGLSYKLGSKFDISGRYNLGLTKVEDYYDSKNSVIQFGVGYRF